MKIFFPYTTENAEELLSRSAPFDFPVSTANNGVVVSAVQYKLRPMDSLTDYIADVEARYRRAAGQGARLIAFPELFGLSPLCCAPVWKRFFNGKERTGAVAAADSSPVATTRLRIYPSERGLLIRLMDLLYPSIEAANAITACVHSCLSEKYSILTADGGNLKRMNGRLYNVQTLYGSDGRIIGTQQKINPMETELRLGVHYAEEIKVFDTEIGRIAIPVCMDASYFENFRLFHQLGARIVALGTCNMESYNAHLALRGVRLRCSEYPMYAVKAAMTGCLAGTPITGCAEIAAPYWCAPGGLLAQSKTSAGDGLVAAAINPAVPFPPDPRHRAGDIAAVGTLLERLY